MGDFVGSLFLPWRGWWVARYEPHGRRASLYYSDTRGRAQAFVRNPNALFVAGGVATTLLEEPLEAEYTRARLDDELRHQAMVLDAMKGRRGL